MNQERLKQLLHYDPETGIFTRLISTASRSMKGTVAGCVDSYGYIKIRVDSIQYKAHRLAWLYMTGGWPGNEVDHKNGIRDDNRWDNLRAATGALNTQNMRKPKVTNKCGFLGVSSSNNRFKATIFVNWKQTHIGTYDTPELAHQAYVIAKRQLHEGCTL